MLYSLTKPNYTHMFGLFMSVNHHHTKWFRLTILKDVLQNSFVLLWDKHTVTAFLLSNSVMESFSSWHTSIIYFVVLIHYCLFFLIMIFMQWYGNLDLNIECACRLRKSTVLMLHTACVTWRSCFGFCIPDTCCSETKWMPDRRNSSGLQKCWIHKLFCCITKAHSLTFV